VPTRHLSADDGLVLGGAARTLRACCGRAGGVSFQVLVEGVADLPTPKISVREVPVACTARVSFLFTARSRSSALRRSSRRSNLTAKTAAGTPYSGSVSIAPLSSHATANARWTGTSFESQTHNRGQRICEQAHRLVNRMKTDLTEDQFKDVVRELAKVFNGGTFDERAFPSKAAPQ
jgi:hypothetical protein